jgi:hypothetical protein
MFADKAIAFTVHRLPTKENKLPFSVCVKQTKVCRFHFAFAANKRKLPFSISSVFPLVEFRKHGDMDVEIWTWRHGRGDMET